MRQIHHAIQANNLHQCRITQLIGTISRSCPSLAAWFLSTQSGPGQTAPLDLFDDIEAEIHRLGHLGLGEFSTGVHGPLDNCGMLADSRAKNRQTHTGLKMLKGGIKSRLVQAI